MSYLTEAQWCIYGSVNKVIIGSDYSTKPLSEPMVVYYPFDPWEQISVKFELKKKSLTMKWVWKCRLQNGDHFFYLGLNVLNRAYVCHASFIKSDLMTTLYQIDGLVQKCSISIAIKLEIPQSCKPSKSILTIILLTVFNTQVNHTLLKLRS